MATQQAKAARHAAALNELDRLSGLLAEAFKIELPNLRPTHRDAELQRIQRVEAINVLLGKVLTSAGLATDPEQAQTEDLGRMTKAELLQKAASQGVEINKSAKKADIIEALESAQSAE